MLIKLILVILMLLMLISLSAALRSLFLNATETRIKTVHWLIIRVTLAALIIIVATVGVVTGQLHIGAPWTGQY